MQSLVVSKTMRVTTLLFLVALALLTPAGGSGALAQDVANPSGLPLPRFVSLRSEPINVRVGPGTRYDIAWVFVRPGLPVEIIQEFDTWRKIRDVDGQEGWIHQNLLIGRRTAYVAPWATDTKIGLYAHDDASAAVRAWLGPKLLVDVEGCDGAWCEVITRTDDEQPRLSGFVAQEMLWGVYAGETFD